MFSLFENKIPGTGQQLVGTGGFVPPSPVPPSPTRQAQPAKPSFDKDRAFLKKLKDMGYDANQAYQALQDVKAGKQPSLGQSQQAAPETPEPEQTGFLSDVRKSAAERAKNAEEIQSVNQTGTERFLQEAGQGAGFLGDVAFAGIKAATPEFVKSGLKATGKATAEALPEFIKNAGIEAAKGGAESYAAWREKNPRSALNLEATVNIGSIIPIGKGAQVAKQGIGAATESTAKAVGKSTVGLRSEIAQSLRKSAVGDVSQALAPTKKEMKLITEKIAPEFVNKGIVGSRETILEKAKTGMSDFGKQIENYVDSGKLVGNVQRKSIDDAIDTFAAGGKTKAGIVIDEEKLLLADKMRSITAKFGEAIPADEAKSVLRVLGEMTARKKGFTTGAEKLSAQLERDVYGVIARELAKANPELDKLNKAFSFYKNLSDVTAETISRTAPQSGMFRKAAATLFAGNGQGQGVIDTAIRYVGSKLFLDFVSSPFYSTVKSRVKASLADAIHSGNTKVADDIIRATKAGKTVTPVMMSQAKKAPKVQTAPAMAKPMAFGDVPPEVPQTAIPQSMLGTAASESVPTVKSKFAPETKWKSENKTALSQELIDAMDENRIASNPVTSEAKLRTIPGFKNAEKIINADEEFKKAYYGFKTVSEKADFVRLVNYAQKNEAKILADYRKGYGNVVNTDEFRPFLGGQRGMSANTNHEVASNLAKKYLAQLLEENKGQGKKFIILAGGAGSGKGATQKFFSKTNPDAVILDGTFANLKTGMENIRNASKMGYDTEVALTMRKFEDAIGKSGFGTLDRAVNMKTSGIEPRAVKFIAARDTHRKSRINTIEAEQLMKEFPNSKVSFWDNTGKPEDFRNVSLDEAKKILGADSIPESMPEWYVSKVAELVRSGKLSSAMGKEFMSAAAFATVIGAMLGTGQMPGTEG